MKNNKEFIYDLSDFVISFILIIVSSPLFILTMFLVIIDSSGPVFYFQERYGKNKTSFWIYKFRSMKVNAENKRPMWGKEADPRSSKIGKLLRISHLDELPQLFNVLNGDMSLIGPRPERPYFADRFDGIIPDYRKRYQVKPGITGWSQVNGLRGETSIIGRSQYDNFYINNRLKNSLTPVRTGRPRIEYLKHLLSRPGLRRASLKFCKYSW